MDKNQKMLAQGSFGELLLRLSLPAVILMIVMVIYNMADTYFIGQTGDPNKISAISLSMPVFTVLSAFGTLFGNGGATYISIALGRGDTGVTKKASAFCLAGGLVVGLLGFAIVFFFTEPIALLLGAEENTLDLTVTYLKIFAFAAPFVLLTQSYGGIMRSDGDAISGMIANMTGSILNIVLDAVLILALHLDVAGAALATVISNIVSFVMILTVILRQKPHLVPAKGDFRPQWKIASSILTLGLPMTCSTLLGSISGTIQNRLMIAHGSVALAAQGVAGKVGMLITMLLMGFCMGMQPAISYNYGRADLPRLRKIIVNMSVFTFLLGTVMTVLCYLTKDRMVALFIDNAEVIAYGQIFVFAAIVISPVYGIYQLCQTFLQATGKAAYAIFTSMLDKGIVFIPVLFIMDRLAGANGIAFAHAVTMVFSLAIGLLLSFSWAKKIRKDHGITDAPAPKC